MKGLLAPKRVSEDDIHPYGRRGGLNYVGFIPVQASTGKPRGSAKFDSVRRRFLVRLRALQMSLSTNTGLRYAFVMRQGMTCKLCGGPMNNGYDMQYRCDSFIWPDSWAHLLEKHGYRPPADFYLFVLDQTKQQLELNNKEKAVVSWLEKMG